jgi:hypothetical protein
MTRSMAIIHIRVAGYHADRATFTRLYVENRVSYEAAKRAYGEGQRMRAVGVRCMCSECAQTGATDATQV